MSVVPDSVVVIDGQEFRGTLTAFPQTGGWWASLIVPADAAPPESGLVGKKAQIKAADREANTEVSKYVRLAGTAQNVQLLLKGDGAALFS